MYACCDIFVFISVACAHEVKVNSECVKIEHTCVRGWSSSVGSVLGLLSCLMQCHGLDPPLRRIFSSRGNFSIEVNMGSDSIPPPPQTLLDQSIN